MISQTLFVTSRYFLMYIFNLSVGVHMCPWKSERNLDLLEHVSICLWAVPCECWDLDSSPFIQQQVLLTTKPSLPPLLQVDFLGFCYCSFNVNGCFAYGDRKRAPKRLGLELQAVVSDHVRAGNPTPAIGRLLSCLSSYSFFHLQLLRKN